MDDGAGDNPTGDNPTGCGGCPDRRTVLRAAATGAGALLVGAAAQTAAAGGQWRVLCATSDVPLGGGIFVEVSGGFTVVVTQPRQDVFRCFSARCTHQGCICNAVRDRRIHCPCHGSQYGVLTGKVLAGPAPQPLSRQRIRVRAGNVELAA